jgi:DNA-binding winged helix-turn-helix (wHTH) protein
MKLRFGEFVLGLDSRELVRADSPVAVEPKVFDLVACLLQNRGRVVSREELMKAVWPGVATTPGSLNRAVSLAREALDDRAREQPIIETVRGQGYRISLPVEWLEDSAGDVFGGRSDEVAMLIDCLEARSLARQHAEAGGGRVDSWPAAVGCWEAHQAAHRGKAPLPSDP